MAAPQPFGRNGKYVAVTTSQSYDDPPDAYLYTVMSGTKMYGIPAKSTSNVVNDEIEPTPYTARKGMKYVIDNNEFMKAFRTELDNACDSLAQVSPFTMDRKLPYTGLYADPISAAEMAMKIDPEEVRAVKEKLDMIENTF